MSIELSPKVKEMLEKLPRKIGSKPLTLEAIEKKLLKANCPLNHAIVDFQLQLGGLCYELHGDVIELGMSTRSRIIYDNNHWLCEFMDFKTSQGFLYMGENGVLYAESSEFPFATSINTFLEHEAILYFFPKQWKKYRKTNLSYSKIQDVAARLKHKSDLRRITEASDKYRSWWISDDYAIDIRKLWGIESYDVTIFAISEKRLEETRLYFMNVWN